MFQLEAGSQTGFIFTDSGCCPPLPVLHIPLLLKLSHRTKQSPALTRLCSSLQHHPRADRPGQPAAGAGLPEERRRSLHGFRQMDQSAELLKPSHCQQADMMSPGTGGRLCRVDPLRRHPQILGLTDSQTLKLLKCFYLSR